MQCFAPSCRTRFSTSVRVSVLSNPLEMRSSRARLIGIGVLIAPLCSAQAGLLSLAPSEDWFGDPPKSQHVSRDFNVTYINSNSLGMATMGTGVPSQSGSALPSSTFVFSLLQPSQPLGQYCQKVVHQAGYQTVTMREATCSTPVSRLHGNLKVTLPLVLNQISTIVRTGTMGSLGMII